MKGQLILCGMLALLAVLFSPTFCQAQENPDTWASCFEKANNAGPESLAARNHDKFMKLCLQYEGKTCKDNKDCGAFLCQNEACLVKSCETDNECPNNMCGRNLTPIPGFCTTQDIY